MKLEPALTNEPVTRHHNTDFVPQLFDSMGKSAGNVCESPCLGKWIDFAGKEKDVEGSGH